MVLKRTGLLSVVMGWRCLVGVCRLVLADCLGSHLTGQWGPARPLSSSVIPHEEADIGGAVLLGPATAGGGPVAVADGTGTILGDVSLLELLLVQLLLLLLVKSLPLTFLPKLAELLLLLVLVK